MPGYVIGNFFIYSVINAFTPGPGNILALNTVTNYGWKKGKLFMENTENLSKILSCYQYCPCPYFIGVCI